MSSQVKANILLGLVFTICMVISQVKGKIGHKSLKEWPQILNSS